MLPADAEPLPNSVGAAPGVLMIEGETLIAALPGVPAEMKAIFEESLWPRVVARFSEQDLCRTVIQTNCMDESIMAPAVDAVQRAILAFTSVAAPIRSTAADWPISLRCRHRCHPV